MKMSEDLMYNIMTMCPRTDIFWTVVLEKTPESPLDSKEIKPVSPKGNQSWIFIERTDDEIEATILWPPDVKNWLIGKDPDGSWWWTGTMGSQSRTQLSGWTEMTCYRLGLEVRYNRTSKMYFITTRILNLCSLRFIKGYVWPVLQCIPSSKRAPDRVHWRNICWTDGYRL